MKQPYAHSMMPQATHDELARQNFVVDLKMHMTDHVYPRDAMVYERRAKPVFMKTNGREPRDRHEVRGIMERESSNQSWSSIARTIQEMLWDVVGESVERQLPALIDRAKAGGTAGGSLTLDSTLAAPRYLSAIDIHAMPGGFHTEIAPDDVFAGALYDRGAYYYSKGLLGPMGDRAGRGVAALLKHVFPNIKPKRILDMGCSIGGGTMAYVEAFPDAEIHAIDISAPLLRYAHARAESLGVPIHFSQQNAESTNFPDGSFDLIVSSAMIHETSRKAVYRIMKECLRLLAPGGVTAHSEVAHADGLSAYEAYMHCWDAYYNAEPFWSTWAELDTTNILAEAGFAPENITLTWRGQDENGNFVIHTKGKDDDGNRGDANDLGRRHLFCATKA